MWHPSPCVTTPPPHHLSNPFHIFEMLDLHATLLLTQCHGDILSTLPCSGALSFGNVNIYILPFNGAEIPRKPFITQTETETHKELE